MPPPLSLELDCLRGPIPTAWIIAAARLPGRSLHVGMALWVISEINQSCIVPLTNLASQYTSGLTATPSIAGCLASNTTA